jgi:hypothetical protein
MAQVRGERPTRFPGVRRWVRSHLALVGGAAAAVLILLVIVVVLATGGSGNAGPVVAPGSIVGTSPLTSGYRLTGKIVKVTSSTNVVRITSLDASGGEARNVVLRPGAQVEFDRPTDGTVALARNGHEVPAPDKLHAGDTIVLVGQFTTVAVPPGPPHPGYAFIGVEATSK